jgi:D-xylose transport system permease protein
MLGGFAAITQVYWEWATLPAIVVTLLLGTAIGLFEGFLIAYLRIPAFIVTLGGFMAYRGILLGITGGRTISPMFNDFKVIGQAYLAKDIGLILAAVVIALFAVLQFSKRRSRRLFQLHVESMLQTIIRIVLFGIGVLGFTLIMNAYLGIPIPVIIMVGLLVIFTFISNRTSFGRNIYAIGGNLEAAKYSGVNIRLTVLFVFMISALLSSVAGLVLTARLDAGTIAAGTGMELDAIAAAVIGGASLAGGIGTVPGAILGALIMASLDNGMSMLNTEAFWQYIVKGAMLVFAVWIDVYTNKKRD